MTSRRGGCNLQVAGHNLEKQLKVLNDLPELLKQNTTIFW